MNLENLVPVAIAGLVALQVSTTAFNGAQVLIRVAGPPPIEGQAVAPPVVSPGDEVLVRWTIVKRVDCPGTNSRVWDGENGFHLTEPARPTALPVTQEPQEYPIQTQIPSLAPSGELHLSIVGAYQCPGSEAIPFTLGPATMTVAPADI